MQDGHLRTSGPGHQMIPVIDIFAGPGGLGEGFSSAKDSRGEACFKLALSIEKEPWAHQTLELRAFFRQFPEPPADYWTHLRGELSREELFHRWQAQAAAAAAEALQVELGAAAAPKVRELISSRIGRDEQFVLVGGPPCQAYSLIGRSRNRGSPGYVPEADVRQTLYLEYLQILADHAPVAFVMENVKGLLSATLSSHRLFDRIREDLTQPASALRREGRRSLQRPRYRLYPLAPSDGLLPGEDPRDFVIQAERFGVPQARHRVIILGVREDVAASPGTLTLQSPKTVKQALRNLPRLRSGLSDGADTTASWVSYIRGAPQRHWFADLDQQTKAAMRDAIDRVKRFRSGRGREFVPVRNGSGIGQLGGVVNHATRRHIGSDLDRYLFASVTAEHSGRSPELADFPPPLLPAHRSASKALGGSHFADRFRVQVADRPATTVTSHISKDGHYYIHFDPAQCRSLTVREAARLQTFPDDYFFCGPRTAQYQQVGNAVPVALARQIAAIVRALL